MTKRPVGRPPRIPRDEPASVTIGNLENQVRLLTARIETFSKERDQIDADWNESVNELAKERSFRRADISRLEECQAKLAATEKRFEGYQAAIVDMFK